jgi:Leucine-rich repeat (LRR) protein
LAFHLLLFTNDTHRQNKLIELSDDLDSLGALTTLSVSSNQVEALPPCLANMHRFEIVSFVHRSIMKSSLHLSFIFSIISLQFVYANGNRISSVPEGICLLTNLKVRMSHTI